MVVEKEKTGRDQRFISTGPDKNPPNGDSRRKKRNSRPKSNPFPYYLLLVPGRRINRKEISDWDPSMPAASGYTETGGVRVETTQITPE